MRIALGASRTEMVRLILWEGLKPVSLGLVAGLAAALALTRYMESLLYGVQASDSGTLARVVLVLLAVCVFANLVPALRATRLDALAALRRH